MDRQIAVRTHRKSRVFSPYAVNQHIFEAAKRGAKALAKLALPAFEQQGVSRDGKRKRVPKSVNHKYARPAIGGGAGAAAADDDEADMDTTGLTLVKAAGKKISKFTQVLKNVLGPGELALVDEATNMFNNAVASDAVAKYKAKQLAMQFIDESTRRWNPEWFLDPKPAGLAQHQLQGSIARQAMAVDSAGVVHPPIVANAFHVGKMADAVVSTTVAPTVAFVKNLAKAQAKVLTKRKPTRESWRKVAGGYVHVPRTIVRHRRSKAFSSMVSKALARSGGRRKY